MTKFVRWFLPTHRPRADVEAPPTTIDIVGTTLLWAISRTLLFMAVYVILALLGGFLNWAAPEYASDGTNLLLAQAVKRAIQSGLVLFLALVIVGYVYLVTSSSKPNLKAFTFTRDSVLEVVSWGLGAAVLVSAFLLLVRFVLMALGVGAPDLIGLLIQGLIAATFVAVAVAPRERFLLAAVAAIPAFFVVVLASQLLFSWVPFDHADRLLWGLACFLLYWLLLTAFRFLTVSRPVQDKAFTVAGFACTFFGLGMLCVFLWNIGIEVGHWLHWVPQMVERANEDRLKAREALKDLAKQKEIKLIELNGTYRKELEGFAVGASNRLLAYKETLDAVKAPEDKKKIETLVREQAGMGTLLEELKDLRAASR